MQYERHADCVRTAGNRLQHTTAPGGLAVRRRGPFPRRSPPDDGGGRCARRGHVLAWRSNCACCRAAGPRRDRPADGHRSAGPPTARRRCATRPARPGWAPAGTRETFPPAAIPPGAPLGAPSACEAATMNRITIDTDRPAQPRRRSTSPGARSSPASVSTSSGPGRHRAGRLSRRRAGPRRGPTTSTVASRTWRPVRAARPRPSRRRRCGPTTPSCSATSSRRCSAALARCSRPSVGQPLASWLPALAGPTGRGSVPLRPAPSARGAVAAARHRRPALDPLAALGAQNGALGTDLRVCSARCSRS